MYTAPFRATLTFGQTEFVALAMGPFSKRLPWPHQSNSKAAVLSLLKQLANIFRQHDRRPCPVVAWRGKCVTFGAGAGCATLSDVNTIKWTAQAIRRRLLITLWNGIVSFGDQSPNK